MFKALLLSIRYDLSDVKLAEMLDDRASFRCFCGFSANEAAPVRTAFVRVRRLLLAHKLDPPHAKLAKAADDLRAMLEQDVLASGSDVAFLIPRY